MSWTIKGEAGKALDATVREVSEVASNLSIRYESLQADVATWSVVGQLATLSDLALPELAQEVSIFRDGTRVFLGYVTARPATVSGEEISVEIEVQGPHFWLEKTPLSDDVEDSEATTQERPEFFFPNGLVTDHVLTLFDRAVTKGLPVDIGAMDTCYEVPRVTLSNVSFADALAALARMVPDAITWWDYSVAGTPEFRLSRRATATVLGLTYGAAPMVSASLAPLLGFETEEVVVSYSERDESGAIIFKEQTAGSSPGLGKRQLIMVSGPPLSEFPFPDPIEVLSVTTGTRAVAANDLTFDKLWPTWRDLEQKYGLQVWGLNSLQWVKAYIAGGIYTADYLSMPDMSSGI